MKKLEITQRYTKSLSPEMTPPPRSPAWISEVDNPYLHGLFAPTTEEVYSEELEVDGELPKDLYGAYFRNGPNNVHKPTNRYHWFDGDGMVHAIWFEDGKARYRKRWIETAGMGMERLHGSNIWPGVLGPFDFSLPIAPLKDTANTDLVAVDGKLLALWYESGQPYRIDPRTLETKGVETFDGKLQIPISAHSKVDPSTGDFLFFSYSDRPPYMRYGVISREGRFHQTEIELPGPRRPHDIGVTPRYSILHDFPVFFDPALFERTGKRIPVFHRDVPTRYGVIPRWGTNDDIRWFDFDPCYMLHVVNCWEDGDWVVMTGCRNPDPTLRPDRRDGRIAAMLSGLKFNVHLWRWRMNMVTGETSEECLDDFNAEFPMMNPSWTGIKNRFSYMQHLPCEIPATFDGIVKYDITDGSRRHWAYPKGVFGSESPFAPRAGATAEDDGYLVSFVTDTRDWTSSCQVFDAQNIERGPIATVRLPHRIPAGFHATWMPGDEIA